MHYCSRPRKGVLILVSRTGEKIKVAHKTQGLLNKEIMPGYPDRSSVIRRGLVRGAGKQDRARPRSVRKPRQSAAGCGDATGPRAQGCCGPRQLPKGRERTVPWSLQRKRQFSPVSRVWPSDLPSKRVMMCHWCWWLFITAAKGSWSWLRNGLWVWEDSEQTTPSPPVNRAPPHGTFNFSNALIPRPSNGITMM